jgi:hypothetical protein
MLFAECRCECRFNSPQQVTFGNNSHELAIIIKHRETANVVFQHDLGGAPNAVAWFNSHNMAGHQVSHPHPTLLLSTVA